MIDDGRRPLPSAAPGACQRHLNDEPIWSFLPPSQPLSFSFFFFIILLLRRRRRRLFFLLITRSDTIRQQIALRAIS